jgi:hypothetical protein
LQGFFEMVGDHHMVSLIHVQKRPEELLEDLQEEQESAHILQGLD